MYHPLPLNMMAGAEINLVTGWPHRMQADTGTSLNRCFTSKRCWQL
jgi:hypothetical protein